MTSEILATFQPRTGFPRDPEKTESLGYIWWYSKSINSWFPGRDQWPICFVHGGNYKLFILFPFLFFFRIWCSYSISPEAHLRSLCFVVSSSFQAPPLSLPFRCIDQSRALRLEINPGFPSGFLCAPNFSTQTPQLFLVNSQSHFSKWDSISSHLS